MSSQFLYNAMAATMLISVGSRGECTGLHSSSINGIGWSRMEGFHLFIFGFRGSCVIG